MVGFIFIHISKKRMFRDVLISQLLKDSLVKNVKFGMKGKMSIIVSKMPTIPSPTTHKIEKDINQ